MIEGGEAGTTPTKKAGTRPTFPCVSIKSASTSVVRREDDLFPRTDSHGDVTR